MKCNGFCCNSNQHHIAAGSIKEIGGTRLNSGMELRKLGENIYDE